MLIENNRCHDTYRPAVYMGSLLIAPETYAMRDVQVNKNYVRDVIASHGLWLRQGAAIAEDNDIARVGPNMEYIHFETK